MASTSLMQNPNLNNATFMGGMTQQRSHFSRHVSFRKHTQISSSKRSIISNTCVMTPSVTQITTTSNTVSTIDIPSKAENQGSNISLAASWKEIQGCNNWENLIDPLHPLLRQEITRYGNFVAACYRAFDLDPNSKRYLNCKYGKKTLLKESGIENEDDYQVTKNIYATPEININEAARGRWIGYVAVSSDKAVKRLGRRDILVTFRGTVTNPEWIANFMSSLTPARLDPNNPRPDVQVESGFLSLYTSDESPSKFGLDSCRQQLLSEISRLLHKYKGEELSITLAGHSMGSSLALLLAYDISELGLNQINSREKVPVTVFSFAGPRVGNLGFKERCEELGVKVLRIANVNDPITKLPGVFFNENFRVLGGKYELPWSLSCYAHVGVELALDFFNVKNPTCVHDLESYIKLVNRQNTRSSSSVDDKKDRRDGFSVDFFDRAKEAIFRQDFKMPTLRYAAINAVNLIGSVSNQMLYYNIF